MFINNFYLYNSNLIVFSNASYFLQNGQTVTGTSAAYSHTTLYKLQPKFIQRTQVEILIVDSQPGHISHGHSIVWEMSSGRWDVFGSGGVIGAGKGPSRTGITNVGTTLPILLRS